MRAGPCQAERRNSQKPSFVSPIVWLAGSRVSCVLGLTTRMRGFGQVLKAASGYECDVWPSTMDISSSSDDADDMDFDAPFLPTVSSYLPSFLME